MNINYQLNNLYNYWFSKKDDYKKWFLDSKKYDDYLIKNYKILLDYLKNKYYLDIDLNNFTNKELVSLVIVFDQLPRQIYRNSYKAYETDKIAILISYFFIDNGLIGQLTENEQLFILLPLQHSENIEDLDTLTEILNNLDNNKLFLYHTQEHRKILEKYGRYPKRNKFLKRISTLDEIIYMNNTRDRDY